MLMLALVLSLVLTACGSESSSEDKDSAKADDNASTQDEEKDKAKNKEKKEADSKEETVESEIGKLMIANKKKDMNKLVENGPMKLTITGIQSATLEPSDNYKELFDNKDKLTIITIGMKVENTSEETVSFHPNQATLTTNAGDQVEAELILSADIGGDFFGPTKKEGEVIFTLDTPAKDISEIKLIINGASNENLDSLGEDIELPLSF
jgi:flagellum-specific peptidoglycan hydrolase FlgJ